MKQLIIILTFLLSVGAGAQVRRYDVVITEIMADPSPQVGLPNAEYLEIKNISGSGVDLFGWKLSDAGTTTTIGVHYMLLPDSAVLLCANSNVSSLAVFGKVLGVSSFPSLDNDGDLLSLKTPSYFLIHAVQYSPEWYGIESKKQGGWSLEMVDDSNPCSGVDNWKASRHPAGGTPCRPNSVAAVNADEDPPVPQRTYSPDSSTICIVFDETVDSASAIMLSSYQVENLPVVAASVSPPLFNIVSLRLASPMKKENVYWVSVTGVKDCKGNSALTIKIKAGLPSGPDSGDIVINEILFDPRSGAYDFVELYNRSNKVVDLNELHLGNRDINMRPSSVKKLADRPLYFFPGEYRVVTENISNLSIQYLVKEVKNVIGIPQLPSYPDDKGDVLLLEQNGHIVDELNYKDDWHFGLIGNAEGISLERIDPSVASNRKDNWHSAASTAGYGTPGYENSQYRASEDFQAAIRISPPVFSPDNDGYNDVLTIDYQLEEQGFVASITIFDLAGRVVRQLVKNDLLAFRGRWTWDGLGQQKQKLMTGTYILLTEIFNLEGKRKIFKETVTLARRG